AIEQGNRDLRGRLRHEALTTRVCRSWRNHLPFIASRGFEEPPPGCPASLGLVGGEACLWTGGVLAKAHQGVTNRGDQRRPSRALARHCLVVLGDEFLEVRLGHEAVDLDGVENSRRQVLGRIV